MARRRPAPAAARGGDGIQAPRPGRARVVTGAAALAALAAAGGLASTGGGRFAPVAQGGAAAAFVLLLIALLLGWAGMVPWSIAILAGSYLVGRTGHATVDGWAAVLGVLLLLSAELATWSTDVDTRVKAERALVVRRTLMLLGLCAAALLANFLLLATSAVSASSGPILATVGTAAAVGAVAFVLRLATRAS